MILYPILRFFLCFWFVEPPKSDDHLGSNGGAFGRTEEGQKENGQLGATKKQAWVAVTKLESWDSSYITATQAQDKVVANEAALAQLKVVASGPVYEQVFNRGSGQLQ